MRSNPHMPKLYLISNSLSPINLALVIIPKSLVSAFLNTLKVRECLGSFTLKTKSSAV